MERDDKSCSQLLFYAKIPRFSQDCVNLSLLDPSHVFDLDAVQKQQKKVF